MRNVNIFKIKYIIALFRWYFKVSKYIKPNKTNISLSRRIYGLPMVFLMIRMGRYKYATTGLAIYIRT